MNGLVVVDASVAVKWLIEEEDSDRAISLARVWANDGVQPVAPYLMPYEVSNALHRRVTAGEMAVDEAASLMDQLSSMDVELHHPRNLQGRALRLASQLGQRMAYDAHYLALADAVGCELWTADRQFYRAARPTARNIRWIREYAATG